MSLRWKNLFIIALAFFGILAVILATEAILLNSFSELEIRATNTDALRARDSISASLSELSSKTGDWANWDDAVVDSYSAIIDQRVYKKARTHQEAVAELQRCSGTQFDPHIVQVFLQLMDHELSLAPTIAAGLMAP
jgi:hypothetical protein